MAKNAAARAALEKFGELPRDVLEARAAFDVCAAHRAPDATGGAVPVSRHTSRWRRGAAADVQAGERAAARTRSEPPKPDPLSGRCNRRLHAAGTRGYLKGL